MITITISLQDLLDVIEEAHAKINMYKGRSEVYVDTTTRSYMEGVECLYYDDDTDNDNVILHIDLLLYRDILRIASLTFN